MISDFSGKVKLFVVEGPTPGKIFEFNEPDNFLLGRDAPIGCHAHLRLSRDDNTVSRNHFLIEINPPDCFLRDVGSLNGTFIIRQAKEKKVFFLKGREERDWEATARNLMEIYHCEYFQEAPASLKLDDGDMIRVGKTILKVKMLFELIDLTSKRGEELASELFHCRHCGQDITADILPKDQKLLASADFLCETCRRKQQAQPAPPAPIRCWGCNKDVNDIANADGRATELQEIALYWCPDCAETNQKKVPLSKIGDYRIIRELGAGGFGVVYLAWQETTNRLSALKVTAEKIKKDIHLLQRFKREVSIHREVLHPHLVRLYDDGVTDDGSYYFVSEYLPVGSLADYFHEYYRNGMPYQEACQLIIQALEGLAYFHETRGLVHRDLKSDNILLRRIDQEKLLAKVGDFGLARSYILHGGTITKPNEYAGTYYFMAPEQITNFKEVTPVSDVYAMGMSLYYLITTEFPYDFPTRQKIMEMVSKGKKLRDAIDIILGDDKPIPIEQKKTAIPQKLAAMINRAINKDATRRFDSALAFKKALEDAIK